MAVAPRPKNEVRGEPAAAAAGGRGGGGLGARLPQLLKLDDRRLQASAFFFAAGSSVVLNDTAANPEHILAGYALFTVGAALAFLTLAGDGRLGRAAARLEEALMGFFYPN